MFVIIDMHQDIAHEAYSGSGFPDWAMADDWDHEQPLGSDLSDRLWATRYFKTGFLLENRTNTLVHNTLRSFWMNSLTNVRFGLKDFPVRDHYLQTVGKVAGFFSDGGKRHPAILGYETFNEPHPVGIDKELFEARILSLFYQSVLQEIRKHDSSAFIFMQPRVDWTVYPAHGPEYGGAKLVSRPEDIESFLDASSIADENAVFSFHYYDPWTMLPQHGGLRGKREQWPGIFMKLARSAISRRLIPFMSEFGVRQEWQQDDADLDQDEYIEQARAYMDLQFQLVEANMLNAAYWVYDLYNERDDNWNKENFSLLGPGRSPRNLDVVARPYPVRSSGRPHLLFFDIDTKLCSIVLEGPLVDSPTVIYVPRKIHYKTGFQVAATSAELEWDPSSQLPMWKPEKRLELNQVVISPPGPLDARKLPRDSYRLMPATTHTTIFS